MMTVEMEPLVSLEEPLVADVEQEPIEIVAVAKTNLRGKTEAQAQEAVREEPKVGIDVEEDRD